MENNWSFDIERLTQKCEAKIRFRNKLLGGVPANPRIREEQIRRYLKKEMKGTLQARSLIVYETEEEVEQKGRHTFYLDPQSKELLIQSRQVKSGLKEATKALGLSTKKKGITQAVAKGLWVRPDWILLGKSAPEGIELVQGVVGYPARSVLTEYLYVETPEIEFQIYWLDRKDLTENEIVDMITVLQEIGLGACRSQGYGKFDVVEFRVTSNKK